MMLKMLGHNLTAGFRLAFFRDCPRGAFTPSWHSVIFVFLLSVAAAILFEALATAPPRIFYPGAVKNDTVYFALLFLGAYAAAFLMAEASKTLLLAVMLYNALFFPLLLFSGLAALQTEFLSKDNIIRDLQIIHWVWAFLITFRAVALVFEPYPLRQILAALAVVALLFYFPARYFYEDRFWYSGSADYQPSPLEKITHEELFQNQHVLLRQQLAALEPARAGRTDLYAVVFGSYGYEDVFMREVRFVTEELSALERMDRRVVHMINNEETVTDVPLATATNLRAALKHLGGMMKEEDVLLLYLTSHGGKDGTLSVHLAYDYSFHQMTADLLAEILQESGIKNRIIFVSACYSGMMIDALKNDHTLIMTSAAKNRQSYGCSDESRLTYFADAYFSEALPQEGDWVKAFARAKKILEQRENAEGKTPHSDPQIFIGQNIAQMLAAVPPKRRPEKTADGAE